MYTYMLQLNLVLIFYNNKFEVLNVRPNNVNGNISFNILVFSISNICSVVRTIRDVLRFIHKSVFCGLYPCVLREQRKQ